MVYPSPAALTPPLPEEVEDVETSGDLLSRGIIPPHSTSKLRWDLCLILLVLFVAVEVPLVVGFQVALEDNTPLYYVDTLVTCAFLGDLVASARTAFTDPHTELLVTTPWRVAGAYLYSSSFALDLFSSMPWDALVGAVILPGGAAAAASAAAAAAAAGGGMHTPPPPPPPHLPPPPRPSSWCA